MLIYLNGETKFDSILYERYCSWRDFEFPYDEYAPVTIHAGAAIVSLIKFSNAFNKINFFKRVFLEEKKITYFLSVYLA